MIYNQNGNYYMIGSVTYTNNNPNCEENFTYCTIKPCQWYLQQFYYPPIQIIDNLDVNKNAVFDKIHIEINNYKTELQINDLEVADITLELNDILGRNILTEKLNFSNTSNIYSTYIKGLLPGIYFISIYSQQNYYFKNLFINN